MNDPSYAPILLFCYNRLEYLMRTIDSLQKNDLAPESELIIFADGEKSHADSSQVKAVREYIQNLSGFKRLEIHLSDENHGLAQSVICGVSGVLQRYEKVIVLEDDLVTAPCFLRFMNEALERYAKSEEVVCVSAYTPVTLEDKDIYFLKGADCWGWGTWRRAWQYFNPDSFSLFMQLNREKRFREFDLNGAYPYSEMLIAQINGKIDSWAIRWYASAFVHDKLTLYSGKNLIKHIGYSGTHVNSRDRDVNHELSSVFPEVRSVSDPQTDQDVLRIISAFFRKTRWSWGGLVKSLIKSIVPKTMRICQNVKKERN